MAHPYQTSSLEGKHKKITSRLIQLIKESDLLPWEQSWGDKDRPVNWATLAPYRGVNAMMLAFTRNVRMYSSPFWVGYMQLKKLKGRVEKGEKGTPIIIPQIYGPVPKTFRHKEDAGYIVLSFAMSTI